MSLSPSGVTNVHAQSINNKTLVSFLLDGYIQSMWSAHISLFCFVTTESSLIKKTSIYWAFTVYQNPWLVLFCSYICVSYHPCSVWTPMFQIVWLGSEMVSCWPKLHSRSVVEPWVSVHSPPLTCVTMETLQRLNRSRTLPSLTMSQDCTYAISQPETNMGLYTWWLSLFYS